MYLSLFSPNIQKDCNILSLFWTTSFHAVSASWMPWRSEMQPVDLQNWGWHDGVSCSDWWLLILEVWCFYSRNRRPKALSFRIWKNSEILRPWCQIFFIQTIWDKYSRFWFCLCSSYDFGNVHPMLLLWFETRFSLIAIFSVMWFRNSLKNRLKLVCL